MEKEKDQKMKTAFEFVGRAHVPSEWRQSDYDYDIETLANLTKSADVISENIARELSEATGLSFNVQVGFRLGSIEWFGYVVALSQEPLVQAAANIGGVLGLVQLIGTVVSRTMARFIGNSNRPYKVGNTSASVIQAPAQTPTTSHNTSYCQLNRTLMWLLILSSSTFTMVAILVALAIHAKF